MGLSLASGSYNRTAHCHSFQVSSLKQKVYRKSLNNKGEKSEIISTRSKEKQDLFSSQMEGSSVPKQEEGEGDANRKKVLEEVVVEELEECKTPTWPGNNKIPIIQNCPPAPRKKRMALPRFSSHMVKRSSATELNFEVRHDEEVESFFQSMFDLTRVSKRCRSI